MGYSSGLRTDMEVIVVHIGSLELSSVPVSGMSALIPRTYKYRMANLQGRQWNNETTPARFYDSYAKMLVFSHNVSAAMGDTVTAYTMYVDAMYGVQAEARPETGAVVPLSKLAYGGIVRLGNINQYWLN